MVSDKYRWVICGVSKPLVQYNDANYCSNAYSCSFFSILIIVLLSLLRVIVYAVKMFFIKVDDNYVINNNLILEVDREYRHQNINKVIIDDSLKPTLIRVFDLTSLMKIQSISIVSLFVQFFYSMNEFFYMMSSISNDEIKLNILKNASVHISSYTYLVCFFKNIKSEYPRCKSFTGGGETLASNAVISAGIDCTYITHGLIEEIYPDAFPRFSSVYLYSKEEKKYLDKVVNIKSYVYTYDSITLRNTSVLIFLGPTGFNNYAILSRVVKLFKKFKYKIFIKIHPVTGCDNWQDNWIDSINIEIFDYDQVYDASAAITSLKPSFVVGSVSTSLCESLQMGVIPIDIQYSPVNKYQFQKDILIYPIDRKCVSWELEQSLINSLLLADISYNDVINLLENR